MTPDDPRHGTTKGHHAGCREACCRKAIARYEKAGRLAKLNGGRAIAAYRAQRRIQALMRLGWTSEDIATIAGWSHRNQVLRVLNGQKGKPAAWVERKTFETICRIYEDLSMRLPERTPYRARAATIAQRKGWSPPLAWDNIDDPNERPRVGSKYARKSDVDPVVVDRLMAGEHVKATQAERNEAMRRWLAMGRSEKSLCEMHGWKDGRYGRAA